MKGESNSSSGSDGRGHSMKFFHPSLLTFVVTFSALTGFMMGFDLSIIAVVLNPINDEFHLCSANEFICFKRELFVAMIAPGALIGSLGGGVFADYYGRRLTLIISDIFFLTGSSLFYFANSITCLLIARALIGVGVGIGFVVFSTYVSEIAPSDRRGRLVLCQEVAQCIGVLVTYLSGALVGDEHWRLLLSSGGLIALIQLAGIPFLPESPRWLLLQGNVVKARQLMRKLGMSEVEMDADHEGSYLPVTADPPPESTKPDQSLIDTSASSTYPDMSHLETTSFLGHSSSLFSRLWNCKTRLLKACGIGIAQNVLCTNAALYFSTDLMLLAGICRPYEWGIGLGVMKFIGTIIAYNLVDNIGRRRLLSIGSIGLSFVFALLSVCSNRVGGANYRYIRLLAYALVPNQDITESGMFCFSPEGANLGPSGLRGPYSILVLIGLFLLLLFWEISWAGLMYVVASEILPSNVRGAGMGIVIACFWISFFLSQLIFEWCFRVIYISGTFIGLSFAGILVWAFVYLFIPDMTGQSLERIHRMLKDDVRSPVMYSSTQSNNINRYG